MGTHFKNRISENINSEDKLIDKVPRHRRRHNFKKHHFQHKHNDVGKLSFHPETIHFRKEHKTDVNIENDIPARKYPVPIVHTHKERNGKNGKNNMKM